MLPLHVQGAQPGNREGGLPAAGRARGSQAPPKWHGGTCLCHHSPGAHKSWEPHPCGLCRCAGYHDGRDPLQNVPALTTDGQRALEMLAQSPAFAGLTKDHLRALAMAGRHRLFLAGTVLMTEGLISDRVYLLARGRVRVERGLDQSLPELVAEIGPGEIVGELSMLRNAPRSATATAVTDLETLEIAADALREVFRDDPQLLMAFTKVMHQRGRPH